MVRIHSIEDFFILVFKFNKFWQQIYRLVLSEICFNKKAQKLLSFNPFRNLFNRTSALPVIV